MLRKSSGGYVTEPVVQLHKSFHTSTDTPKATAGQPVLFIDASKLVDKTSITFDLDRYGPMERTPYGINRMLLVDFSVLDGHLAVGISRVIAVNEMPLAQTRYRMPEVQCFIGDIWLQSLVLVYRDTGGVIQ